MSIDDRPIPQLATTLSAKYKRNIMSKKKNAYGTGKLILDVVLTLLTGGLWLIVILIQFLRRNTSK